MSRNEKNLFLFVIVIILLISMIFGMFMIACLEHDGYVNELEEKVNKYEIENKVGDIEC